MVVCTDAVLSMNKGNMHIHYSHSQTEHAGDPSTWKLRQEDYGFRVTMGYLAGFCLREREQEAENKGWDTAPSEVKHLHKRTWVLCVKPR